MNCHSSYCFPMVLQLYSFTGAWQIKMMLVWGFSLMQNHSFSRLQASYSCKKHIFTQDNQLFPISNTQAFSDTSHSVLLTKEIQKEIVFLMWNISIKESKALETFF